LREQSTLAERLLWADLRALKLNARRQVPIGQFIADFAHHGAKLIIEIDGCFHTLDGAAERDAARTRWLQSQGYRVLRFSDEAVRNSREIVLQQIEAALAPNLTTGSPPTPTLPPSRGKGE
jgi:very-short-patch-repair endonuclease